MEFTEDDFWLHYGGVINLTTDEEIDELLNKTSTEQLVCRFFSEKYAAEDGIHCNASYDSVLCWPATPAGSDSIIPCPGVIHGVYYDSNKTANRHCLSNGTWDGYSNYTQCRPLAEAITEEPFPDMDATILIYFIGFSLSTMAVVTALLILALFKDLRCLRNTVHVNLMATYLLRDLTWIIMASLRVDSDRSHTAHCTMMVILYYFQGTNFFWMFVEGFYLYMLVVRTFVANKIPFNVYVFIGWGLPVLLVIAWAIVKSEVGQRQREALSGTSTRTGCPWLEKDVYDWVFNTPILLVLLLNMTFLTNIMWVLITKLRAATSAESQQYRKASKALLVLIPLLGVTYVLVIVSPKKGIMAYTSAIMLSTQGLTVSVLYCFLNGEVRHSLQYHYRTWRNSDHVTSSWTTTRTSLRRNLKKSRNGSFKSVTESIRLCSLNHETRSLEATAAMENGSSTIAHHQNTIGLKNFDPEHAGHQYTYNTPAASASNHHNSQSTIPFINNQTFL